MTTVVDETSRKGRALRVNAAGELLVSAAVTASAGAATAANQVLELASLALVSTAAKQDTLLAAVASAAKQDTLAALVATSAKQDTLQTAVNLLATSAKQDTATALMPTPKDSTGLALPANFDYLAETYGYTGDNLTTIVKTFGGNTYTQTLGYSGSKVVSASQWVLA